ncbi:heme NO-binding domain-containing protein [Neorhodopirellula pilleata]|uniref:Heme NO binding protein n=1 Tax=Neorhodopirellula pilleata TaxID=2714738 RepID=A0A5C6A7P8_9BACT|nr:heme NO-binding domain-containing protein [Neorhodopirellula pilleata]TWT94323.1 Heme NO binding protein [Neorhodopirellula pilleata]
MKGIVFTELIEMVEADLGIEIVDRMLTKADTPSQGSYTAVGTYDHGELIRLVIALSGETGIPVSELVRSFGRHLFGRFATLYPQFFRGVEGTLDFLPLIETYIHVEVRKLYPDAELPSFESEFVGESLEFYYQSSRPFADLAEGLVLACVDHFNERLDVQRIDLGDHDGRHAKFVISPAQRSPIVAPAAKVIGGMNPCAN